MLKLCVLYGIGGNIGCNIVFYLIVFYYDFSFVDGMVGFVNIFFNKDICWEKIMIVNVGVDFVLFCYCLLGIIEYYNKYSVDLFVVINGSFI